MEDRRRQTSVRQLELLLEFLQEHQELALGRARSKEACAVATRFWRECSLTLNNAEGPARTPKEWSKVWNDLKCRVRAKLVSNNANQQGTAGGPRNIAVLTPLEDRVARIIGLNVGPIPNVKQDEGMEDRRRHISIRQLELLLEFLQEHQDLALGRSRSKEACAVAMSLWRECSLILNAEGPARTPKEWSKAWNVLKVRVRAKLVSNNTNQQGTEGGPRNTAALTPLEERVASIMGLVVGPIPNVRNDSFSSQDGEDGNIESSEISFEVVRVDDLSESMLLEIKEEQTPIYPQQSASPTRMQDIDWARPDVASPTPSITGQAPSSSTSQTERNRKRRQRLRRRPTTTVPPAQSIQTALEESRSMVLRIESMRAETELLNAQAMKTIADGFKLLAESVDRFTKVYARKNSESEGRGRYREDY